MKDLEASQQRAEREITCEKIVVFGEYHEVALEHELWSRLEQTLEHAQHPHIRHARVQRLFVRMR